MVLNTQSSRVLDVATLGLPGPLESCGKLGRDLGWVFPSWPPWWMEALTLPKGVLEDS